MTKGFPGFRCLVPILCAGALVCGSRAEGYRQIGWEDLLPAVPQAIDDPFAKLSPDQLLDLGMVSRIRHLRATGEPPIDGLNAQEEEKLVAQLGEQGIDVDWILAQRERVALERQKLAEAVDGGMDGQRVRIPGYILPLSATSDGRVTEFLLVPWVGACIHTPPPPPNQMVHASIPEGTGNRNRFSAIWIEGTIELKPSSYDLFLVDGTRNINVAYTMVPDRVVDYSSAESDELARVKVPAESLEGHSWWQIWQTKISLLFTKTMTDIKDRRSSGPLFWGLLVAFLYGVIHTLGPGHGKAVVISYFVGERGSLGRGVRMGTQIAIFHVLSAIIVVWLADFAVRQATGQAPSDYRAIRLGSYALIAAIGAFMLWKALRAMKQQTAHPHSHEHEHHEGGCHACAALENQSGPSAWLALAVGAVPCTGALLVLLFGMANDLLGPAILLVIAISLGMAVAMSGIGVLAITGRRLIDRRMDPAGSTRFAARARVAGASLILLIGVGLFSLTIFNPLGPTATPSPEAVVQSPGE